MKWSAHAKKSTNILQIKEFDEFDARDQWEDMQNAYKKKFLLNRAISASDARDVLFHSTPIHLLIFFVE